MINLSTTPADVSLAAFVRSVEAVANYQDRNALHTPAPEPRPLSPARLSAYQREIWHALVAKGWREVDATSYVRRMA